MNPEDKMWQDELVKRLNGKPTSPFKAMLIIAVFIGIVITVIRLFNV